MKQIVLLSFLLLGLCFVDWGCSRDCDEYEVYEIIDLSIGTITYDTAKLPRHKYNENVFVLFPKTNRISSQSKPSNSLYASVFWGCEIQTHVSYTNSIDSFTIQSDKPYNSEVSDDVSGLLANAYNFKQVDEIIFSSVHAMQRLNYALSAPPSKSDTFQFTFQFFDSEGNVFETTTDPMIITP